MIAEALEQVERGEIKRLIIEMPPQHGKSTLASINFPAWYLGKHPESNVITSSYSGDLAQKFGGKTRDIINDAQYQTIFKTKLKEDSQSKGKWETEEHGSYTSVGLGGATTGRGADIFLIDDPFANRAEAESKVVRENVWDWYTSTAYTRLSKEGAVIIIMTRWHTDDLVARVLAKSVETGEQWTVISFPAIAEKDEQYRLKGEALWPRQKDTKDLEIIRKLNIYDWFALWQQNPVASATQEFKREWFQPYKFSNLFQNGEWLKDLYFYTMVDLAGTGDQADNNAIVTVAKERNRPEIYVMDVHAGHLDPGQVIDYLFALKAKYGYRWVRCGIEAVAYQRSMVYWIQEKQKSSGTYFDIVELRAQGSKEVRVRGLLSMYRAGVIYHVENQIDLEEELLVFPKGKKDDRADALAYLQQILENTSSNNKQFNPKIRM